MIKVSVDEAYAFDMLSILMIKDSVIRNSDLELTLNKLLKEIQLSLKDKFDKVIESEEFSKLFAANLEVFNMIDVIKKRAETVGDATAIDQGNYKRYLAKKELQTKFFPEHKLTETKIGYKE